MMPPVDITLQPLQPADQDAVKTLILAGLQEHWGWIDPALNPDLEDIAVSFAGAVFLVAWQGRRIVGCGALRPHSSVTAEVVRMSVAADLRDQGIGGLILARLLQAARQAGFQQVILETTASWQEVVTFYQRHGFKITHYQQQEYSQDVYMAIDLNP